MAKTAINRNLFTFISVLILSVILSGCDFFTGPAGGAIPGGIVQIDLNFDTNLDYTNKLIIAFDPDVNVSDGDEYTVEYPLGDYMYDFDGIGLNLPLPWSAPDVPEGLYFVYCWVDYIENGVMDASEADSYSDLLGASVGYYFDTTGPVFIDQTYGSEVVFPTYAVDGGYVPQIDFLISDTAGGV